MKNIKISELIAKDVIAIDNGENVGYILNVCFETSLTKLKGFVVADEESERENYLSKKDIKILGEDCVFIDDIFRLELNYSGEANNPIGKKVYSYKGEFLGVVKDVVCEGVNPSQIITSVCMLPINKIYSTGVDCLFFSEKKKRKKRENLFNFTSDNLLPKVEAQSFEIGKKDNFSNFQIKSNKNNIVINPSKLTLAPSTLLNKTATCDIYGMNNEIIIKEGQVINQGKIDKAKKHGKINLLILNSK